MKKPVTNIPRTAHKSHKAEIIFEDEWLIIINKPSGMLSVGFPGYRGKTALDILADLHRSRGKIHIAAVHRLDRDTSGVMMFACTAEAKERIMDNWQEMVTERTYRCVCERNYGAAPLPDAGIITAPLAYNRNDVAYVPKTGDAKAMKEAEKAVTRFKVIERGKRYDLVECELETGRKNQIRAHMAHLAHPVLGDEVYGNARDDAGDGIGRLALHARILAFTHPFTGTHHRFEIPEPATFAKIVVGNAKSAQTAGSGNAAVGKTIASERAGSRTRVAESALTIGKAQAANDGSNLPRRQRGKKPEVNHASDYHSRREISPEDITDLKPKPRKSRTRQDTGKSRFIPGKQGKKS